MFNILKNRVVNKNKLKDQEEWEVEKDNQECQEGMDNLDSLAGYKFKRK